jgi:hydroxymethylglutaryl-CoA synthase
MYTQLKGKNMMVNVGIDQIAFYTPKYYLELEKLAHRRKIDMAKIHALGHSRMSVLPEDEDIITMGIRAAQNLNLHPDILNNIEMVLFATESSHDLSKSSGLYVHQILNLPSRCRVLEFKQACYAGTGAVRLAAAFAAQHPSKKVLVIASDAARYAQHTLSEFSQGCAAVAMLISSHPALMVLHPHNGLYAQNTMDFWHPNSSDIALAKPKLSSIMYLKALEKTWESYRLHGSYRFEDFTYCCYHMPIPKLVINAHRWMLKKNKSLILTANTVSEMLTPLLIYPKAIGNSYTASLYVSFISLLHHSPMSLANQCIGFYSYGSGATAEFFTGMIQPNYQNVIERDTHQKMLCSREAISVDQYETLYAKIKTHERLSDYTTHLATHHGVRFAGVKNNERVYQQIHHDVTAAG